MSGTSGGGALGLSFLVFLTLLLNPFVAFSHYSIDGDDDRDVTT